VALDAPGLSVALDWCRTVGPFVSVVKIGLEMYLRDGPDGVTAARDASGCPVFLDLKLHDIPNTVAGAARAVSTLAPDFLTVHALGGATMIRAAVESLPDTRVAAVTVLTSMSAEDLHQVGLGGTPLDAVRRLAALAVSAGARALVCSPHEVAVVRTEVGPDIILITPGVRPQGQAEHDQARVATPRQALADGADLLVVGRPLTAAPRPDIAARDLARDLAETSTGWRRAPDSR
jgi:orotidine-5'-phosphate decarboxylase